MRSDYSEYNQSWWSEELLSQSGAVLPTLPVDLKCKVLLACVAARRQREQQRRSTLRGLLVSALVVLCMVGFDALQSPYFDLRTPPRAMAAVQTEVRRIGVSSSEYAVPEHALATLGTWEHVEQAQSFRAQQRKKLFDLIGMQSNVFA